MLFYRLSRLPALTHDPAKAEINIGRLDQALNRVIGGGPKIYPAGEILQRLAGINNQCGPRNISVAADICVRAHTRVRPYHSTTREGWTKNKRLWSRRYFRTTRAGLFAEVSRLPVGD